MRRQQRKSNDDYNPETLQRIFQLGLERYETQTGKSLSDRDVAHTHRAARAPDRMMGSKSFKRPNNTNKSGLAVKKNKLSRPKSQQSKVKTTNDILNRNKNKIIIEKINDTDLVRRGRTDVLK